MGSKFGRYSASPATLVRPLSPEALLYTLDQQAIDLLRSIERLDEALGSPPAAAKPRPERTRRTRTLNAQGAARVESPGGDLTERDIVQHERIMEGLDGEQFPLAVDDILALHARRFAGILPHAGRLKDRPNFIVDPDTQTVAYVPTPPESTRAELQAALDWLHGTPGHPLVHAEVFFHEFQSIHPFLGGNHRLGRLLVALYLAKHGFRGLDLVPTDHRLGADPERYWTLLDQARRPAWDRTPWVQAMLLLWHEAYVQAHGEALFANDMPPGVNDRQMRVAMQLATLQQAEPSAWTRTGTIRATLSDVPRRTLAYDLRMLTRAGVIERRGERKGTRYRLLAAARPDIG